MSDSLKMLIAFAVLIFALVTISIFPMLKSDNDVLTYATVLGVVLALLNVALVGVALWYANQQVHLVRVERVTEEIFQVQTLEWANKENLVYKTFMEYWRFLEDNSARAERLMDAENDLILQFFKTEVASGTYEIIRDVARAYNRIGYKAYRKIISEKELLDLIHPEIIKLWCCIRPWLVNELLLRASRDQERDYMRELWWLARRSVRYRDELLLRKGQQHGTLEVWHNEVEAKQKPVVYCWGLGRGQAPSSVLLHWQILKSGAFDFGFPQLSSSEL